MFIYGTDMHIFNEMLVLEFYCSVSTVHYQDEVLHPTVRFYTEAVGFTFVLMIDNVRSHRAIIVDDYLESQMIASMEWPEYSPKLNPIENLWDANGRAVYKRFPPQIISQSCILF